MTEKRYILGLSAYYHDSAAALLCEGELVAAAQEERFTRKRHDAAFPIHAVQYCLREAGIDVKRVDHVVFYDKPVPKFARLLESHLAVAPRGLRSWLTAIPIWLRSKLWTAREVEEALDCECDVLFTEHHHAHAASAFFPSPFDHAAVLTVDGVGEWATTTSGVGRGKSLELDRELRFPHSLGLLYSAFTYYTGFKVNSGEYKLMGLAPYGKPKFQELILKELVDLKDDGSFALDMRYFDYVGGLRMTNARFDKLMGGPARAAESPLTQREMDLAASVQAVTEEVMIRLCRDLHARTKETALCLAGGVALNCVANGKLIGNTGFEKLWVQPAAGDAGGAIGAAYALWHQYLDQERPVPERDAMKGALLGPRFSDDEIVEELRSFGAVSEKLERAALIERVAALLAEGNVVGWFQGRMEFGPRALGARSLLGDARSAEMQKTMNLKIKFRESFRPFAPAVLEESADDWFDLKGTSPYMLVTAQVNESKRVAVSESDGAKEGIALLNVPKSVIPAVTHVDGSARVQTVNSRDNPRFYELLGAFGRITGTPVLINTSFNLRGEPIVCTPREAYVCFMRSGIDYLVLEDRLLDKKTQPEWREAKDWREQIALD